MKMFDLKYDFMFKRVFGAEDDLSKGALKGLLSSYLGIEIEDITHHNVEVKGNFIKEKDTFFDFFCTLSTGERINVEMQMENDPQNLKPRLLYYLARNMQAQAIKGKDYSTLKQCVHIIICDFTLFKEEDVETTFLFRSKQGTIFHDLMKIVVIELPKIDLRNWNEEDAKEMSEREAWSYYLKHCADDKKLAIIKVLKERHGDIAMADKKSMELSKSEYEALQEMYEFKAQMEEDRILRKWKKQGLEEGHKLGLDEGRKQGLEEGRKQGLEQGINDGLAKQKSMILAMHEKLSIEEIADLIHMSIEEINQIIH